LIFCSSWDNIKPALCYVREVIQPERNRNRKGAFQVAVCCPNARDLPEAAQRMPTYMELATRSINPRQSGEVKKGWCSQPFSFRNCPQIMFQGSRMECLLTDKLLEILPIAGLRNPEKGVSLSKCKNRRHFKV
jgi:hypothetical protein